MGREVRRVLVYRLGSLGDTVAALPCLHLVARAFPVAERRMLTNFPINTKAAAAAAVLGESGLIHGYFEYPAGSRRLRELFAIWWKLLRWRPQVVVYAASARGLVVARRDAWFFRSLVGRSLVGPRLVGVPLTEDMQRNRVEAGVVEPECERLARNLAELGDARLGDGASWDLGLTALERARAHRVLAPLAGRRLVMFSLGTKLQANEWGVERWRQLLGAFAARYPEAGLAFTGVPAESDASEYAAEGWRAAGGGPVVNLCGVLSPRESAACFERAQVFLGHDSGPMHLAASVGTRVVAVFSSRNLARKWFPYGGQHRVFYREVDCMGCGLEVCTVEGKKCIYGIGVEEVFGAVCRILDEERTRGSG